jgi:UDP-N-acetylmuramoylalanine--D-glutamate ligase
VTIGVTGTRGKSTTTHLIEHILKTAGKSTLLGGNVRAVATLPMLKDIKPGDIAVLELDSWQLQGFGDSKISPHVAVFTTFMDDHMNYYGGDRAKYFADKANIYAFQKKGDTLVVGEEIAQVIMQKKQGEGDVVVAHRESVPKEWDIKIPGEHNLLNIACAIEAVKAIGILEADIRAGVESFLGVEGRLQFVKEYRGVKIYNDSNATTPEATVAGLRALGNHRNVVLIMGGTDKNLDMTPLLEEVAQVCRAVAFFRESGTDKIKDKLMKLPGVQVVETETFEESVLKGVELAVSGDMLLFSPAFASFGRFFKNEYDRNDQFMKIITELQ